MVRTDGIAVEVTVRDDVMVVTFGGSMSVIVVVDAGRVVVTVVGGPGIFWVEVTV